MIVFASFEDFLYIIIGLVWVIFSYYNAQKKKQRKTKQPPSKKEPSLFETILEEIGGEEHKAPPAYSSPYTANDELIDNEFKDVEQENYIDSDPEEVFSYDDYYEESNFSPVTNVINNKQPLVSDESSATKIDTKKPTLIKAKKIDLRKAVIYSEILKRRYF